MFSTFWPVAFWRPIVNGSKLNSKLQTPAPALTCEHSNCTARLPSGSPKLLTLLWCTALHLKGLPFVFPSLIGVWSSKVTRQDPSSLRSEKNIIRGRYMGASLSLSSPLSFPPSLFSSPSFSIKPKCLLCIGSMPGPSGCAVTPLCADCWMERQEGLLPAQRSL